MRIFRSLTNRIFLATALIAILSIGLAMLVVNGAVTRQAEDELTRGLEYAASLVEQNRDLLVEQLVREARLVADLPKLKAAVGVDHPPTLEPIVDDYRRQIASDVFLVTNAVGAVLAPGGSAFEVGDMLRDVGPIHHALEGRATIWFWPQPGGGVQVATVPVWIDEISPELLGTLTVGFNVDHALALRFKALTDSEVVFVAAGAVQASTLSGVGIQDVEGLQESQTPRRLRLGEEDYVGIARSLAPDGEWVRALDASLVPAVAPVTVVLRSRTGQLAFLRSLQAALVATAGLGVLVATLLSYAVARTVTRPVAAIIATMREMSATGDLTKRISLPDRGNWSDDDTRLLAGTFNTMTASIERFQREASERERLSALGRLSTVIAHEVRNPLMIIKASLRTLRREGTGDASTRRVADDIDEEVNRLNRIVGEVLDFARPIRFEYGTTSLSRVCTEAVEAVEAEPGSPEIATVLAPEADPIVTDAERLRSTLVNLLNNARQAVHPASEEAGRSVHEGSPPIVLETHDLGPARVAIVVRDRGVGIPPDDVPRVFDPYFTTRRTGSGLGLAIAKNVVDGLGGSIVVTSRVDEGTEMRIELPRLPPSDAEPSGRPRRDG